MDPDGSSPVQLTTNGGYEPTWSTDGTRIAFTRQRQGSNSGDWEVLVMNADGTDIRPLSNDENSDEEPQWR